MIHSCPWKAAAYSTASLPPPQHNAVDIPAQGGLANGQGLQSYTAPQGGKSSPYRTAVGGLGCDDRFHAVISFPALFRRGKVAGITI